MNIMQRIGDVRARLSDADISKIIDAADAKRDGFIQVEELIAVIFGSTEDVAPVAPAGHPSDQPQVRVHAQDGIDAEHRKGKTTDQRGDGDQRKHIDNADLVLVENSPEQFQRSAKDAVARMEHMADEHEMELQIERLQVAVDEMRKACNDTEKLLKIKRKLTEEEEIASREIEAQRKRGACKFWFLHADVVRKSNEKTLPRYQELRRRGGHLEQIEISRSEAFRRVHSKRILVISHRWEDPSAPDSEGVQMTAIKEYLDLHPAIEYVWYDYWCMPQGRDKTKEDLLNFKWMLQEINALYLGCSVLCLIDISYLSRFWIPLLYGVGS